MYFFGYDIYIEMTAAIELAVEGDVDHVVREDLHVFGAPVAETALRDVRRAGFPSAFVIAFDGGAPLSLQKARKKESSVTVVTEEIKIVR